MLFENHKHVFFFLQRTLHLMAYICFFMSSHHKVESYPKIFRRPEVKKHLKATHNKKSFIRKNIFKTFLLFSKRSKGAKMQRMLK